ncbi:hypothetical protein CLV92_1095 [Kineococcus xinjiangensis]|uniref:Uncharacterized protein n=1 Tax=Kineococcus xinjiangensis TaxID=512762 RepID=A0A2S6IHP1_9ACTN|nr:hypothetical protein CLV92_1095 [Kineococcus xinjiangensis]
MRGGQRRYDAKGPERGTLHLPRDGAPSAGYQGLVMLCGCLEGPTWKPAFWSVGDAVSRRCKRCVRSVGARARAAARLPGRPGLRAEQLTLPLGD